ncbi:hypothetical protein BHE74_00059694 [Ensete ventricosum]|uniref:Uncharacterized protein n=1 Tax=Ensete ventricosum TaxID=4639 RepID=A0A426Y7W2_ENSVE|nr:hypothetical protein B296_00038960 [Ensete ventricosum]RWW35381.1 hypothetical protein BHE74_00059694 [Ensete ventricosum]RZR83674.1 hypothetical protein BHM03_00010351 [Ensete ventricosum]
MPPALALHRRLRSLLPHREAPSSICSVVRTIPSCPCSHREASPPLWGGERRGRGRKEAARKSRWRGGEEKGNREERGEEGGGGGEVTGDGEGPTVVPRSGAEGDGWRRAGGAASRWG